MKTIIYSIYIENNEPNLSEKHQFTKKQLEKHWQKLIDVKKEYAKHCNADFRIYGNDWGWQAFKKKFNGYEFDVINLYKIHLWEELGKTYDNVLYLDFDVVPIAIFKGDTIALQLFPDGVEKICDTPPDAKEIAEQTVLPGSAMWAD